MYPNSMKLLRLSFTATLKTFRRHMLRNVVSPPNVNSYNVVIRGFAAAGSLEPESWPNTMMISAKKKVAGLMSAMTEKGVEPNSDSLNEVIQGLCREWRTKEAEEVFEEMKRKGFAPDEKTYTSLIDLLCDYDDKTDKADKVLREMIDRGFSPSVVEYNKLIRAYCCYGYCQTQKLEKALEIKKEMVEKGFLPDAHAYSVLLRSKQIRSSMSEAFDLFREMLREGVEPMAFSLSLVTCNALIHGLGFLGRAEEALAILRGMAEMGLSPDTVCYTAVVFGFCRIGELRKAYDLKLEMDEMILSRKLAIHPLSGDVYWSLMGEEGGLLDEVNYTRVVNAYCDDCLMNCHTMLIRNNMLSMT
ncbi:pentatricopeptide repeat-containing protein At5g39710-like [Lotus japonicus]|uniref:pentatricopeptide repeat-containing protein At5g39710-like n=1 Tax=Lotus japonicus TaxID=34305 RepID=UPI002588D213|nr:pentatricopeptide repeat-containing protein At5g39710-like [Lotus japonicus]